MTEGWGTRLALPKPEWVDYLLFLSLAYCASMIAEVRNDLIDTGDPTELDNLHTFQYTAFAAFLMFQNLAYVYVLGVGFSGCWRLLTRGKWGSSIVAALLGIPAGLWIADVASGIIGVVILGMFHLRREESPFASK